MPRSRLIKLNAPVAKPLARKRDKRDDAVQVIMRRCTRCRGTGQAVCQICNGAGAVMAGRDVFGRIQQVRCAGCFGSKCTRCVTCAGTGWV
jgi:DnaJ-class molecular chaperone